MDSFYYYFHLNFHINHHFYNMTSHFDILMIYLSNNMTRLNKLISIKKGNGRTCYFLRDMFYTSLDTNFELKCHLWINYHTSVKIEDNRRTYLCSSINHTLTIIFFLMKNQYYMLKWEQMRCLLLQLWQHMLRKYESAQ